MENSFSYQYTQNIFISIKISFKIFISNITLSIPSKDEICKARDLAIRLLTGGNSKESLGIQQYKEYKKRVLLKGSNVLRTHVLPPPTTSWATMEHYLLTYHQIMN